MTKELNPNHAKSAHHQSTLYALSEGLAAAAAAQGFCSFGIAPAHLAPKTAARLRHWLEAGCHGDMIWMADRAEQRASPIALWPAVQSVIMVGMSYAPASDPMALAAHPTRGRISLYAQGADYHKKVKQALKGLARWLITATEATEIAEATETSLESHRKNRAAVRRTLTPEVKVFVDTAPVMEKPLAEAAGLGWQGKHSNIVSRTHGSWLFLGALYTSLALPPSQPGRDRCGSCLACQDICPTQAFIAPYRLDARRCISYLTIEHSGHIPEELRVGIGNHIYGCDDCLAVCPWNKFARQAQANRAFLPRAELAAPSLEDLLRLDQAAFDRVFAGTAIKRIGRERMVRNAAIAAGNSKDPRLIPTLQTLCHDSAPIVAESARWAIGQLTDGEAKTG